MIYKHITQTGFTLIEVLVAMLIFSIGLLGLTGLQLASTNYNHNSYLRSVAIILSNDMADRMRANQVAVASGAYNSITHQVIPHLACQGKSSDGTLSTLQFCNSNELAEQDLYEWQQLISNALPNGIGVVCIDSTPLDGTSVSPDCDGLGTNLYTIKIWWSERASSYTKKESQISSSYTVSFEP